MEYRFIYDETSHNELLSIVSSLVQEGKPKETEKKKFIWFPENTNAREKMQEKLPEDIVMNNSPKKKQRKRVFFK